jgi:hypothetical protein
MGVISPLHSLMISARRQESREREDSSIQPAAEWGCREEESIDH